ncbi:hypothetical protein WDZ16_13225 [Pseudokineococcus marinus]|uniref:PH domain-containing protein n=1 Tax=Pseudokineococcus marinus TaxID=351215 RepID=A0A849BQ73_9ACTN|nr:hypothetical protein [Pseudokineococcus marinus]NNH23523.1 hypothetical protein [Pseudokineococcus marinus]
MARGRRGDDDEPAVVVDLEGLPRVWRTSQARWMPWLWGSMAALAALQLAVAAIWDVEMTSWRVVLQVAQVVAGLGAAVWASRLAVRFESTGYRLASTRRGGGLRPWSRVAEIRPPSRWLRFADIRGTRGGDVPVALVGMTAEQAEDLQRRLVEARARVQQTS